MRIMYIIDSTKFGGAEMLLLAMVQRYAPDHEVSVVYFTHGPLYEDYIKLGVKIQRITTKGLKDPLVFPRLISLMRSEKPDVVHTHLSKSDFLGLPAALIAGVPARISTIHNVDQWRQNRLFSFIMRQWERVVHHHIAVSSKVRDYVLEYSHYPASKITTIDNGVDTDQFNPTKITPVSKAEWNIPADAPVIGMVARLEASKAHHLLLDAAALVVKAMPKVRFLIVGEGPLRPDLEAQREQLGLQQNVIFAGLRRDVPNIMAMLDIVTFSSKWEGLPVAMLEGMAMARPIVSTSVGGIPDVITSGKNGLLAPSGDAHALAEGYLKVLNDPALAKSLGDAARQTVIERFSAAAMHQNILDLYNTILKRSGAKTNGN
ncbi:MAG: glycosyltransferase [Anaerolineae bacterium]|nr:glycosyltransferase [Anaerolineae bacterium]